MTDKQIMIDDVDVSGCLFYQANFEEDYDVKIKHYCSNWHNSCESNNKPNCYYKQLKHKEQECEKLKNERTVDPVKQLFQLKAENEELKTMLKDLSYENQKFCYQIEEQIKQLEPFKDEYFKGLDNVVIAELAKKSIRITAENSKLEQTLTEIKEIAETAAKCLYATKSDDYTDGYRWLGNIILQKIGECEVEDEHNG